MLHKGLMTRRLLLPLLLAIVCLSLSPAQQQVPDAPSATRPPAPQTPIPNSPPPPPRPQPPAEPPRAEPEQPAPGSPVETAPQTQDRENLTRIIVNVNYVIVPVIVKDGSGHLVEGLLPKDFTVLEDGEQQRISFFTSDPFPLSAALLIDDSIAASEMQKVKDTYQALSAAFAPYDEVSVYTFGHSVTKVRDFGGAGDSLIATLVQRKLKGDEGGMAIAGGPMTAGPTVNGHPADPSAPIIQTATREARVLNDAIIAAANDLAHRDRSRRKILFVISDGTEYNSEAGPDEVLKVLLSNEISVFAIGVDAAAIPGLRTLRKLHIPGMGYGNLLPYFASRTGGQVYPSMGEGAIEKVYARLTEEARNQYTLGYTTRASAASNYRSVEVVIHRPGLKVFAKDGYYPLPPKRQ